ncbi:hypothetical protein T07_2947 [Trichinella nelsoni]|uniref:Uncharacterized protein n=1 Tax=Trichinella nelsoni TaxID=6336 RepID=A0A0V0RU26_9BILA|nr:hypothetical protein T07_2947 [Trichinella nelsoni]
MRNRIKFSRQHLVLSAGVSVIWMESIIMEVAKARKLHLQKRDRRETRRHREKPEKWIACQASVLHQHYKRRHFNAYG